MRRQESGQEPCGSWRLCSLPRSHLGHRQEYVRTNGPWIADSGSCGAGKRPVRSPRFSVVRSDRGPCSLAGDSPPHPAPATESPGRICAVPPVEGERHTLRTLKPRGFN